jgi:hypothetical protein
VGAGRTAVKTGSSCWFWRTDSLTLTKRHHMYMTCVKHYLRCFGCCWDACAWVGVSEHVLLLPNTGQKHSVTCQALHERAQGNDLLWFEILITKCGVTHVGESPCFSCLLLDALKTSHTSGTCAEQTRG